MGAGAWLGLSAIAEMELFLRGSLARRVVVAQVSRTCAAACSVDRHPDVAVLDVVLDPSGSANM